MISAGGVLHGTTTCGDVDPTFTDLLSDMLRKRPEFTAPERAHVAAFYLDVIDSDQRAVVKAWPEHSEAVRVGISAIARAANPS